jgi:hypothetical protein
MNVQSDYVVGWKEEQGFWSTVEQLCPDIDDGTVIFVEPTGLRDTRQLLFLRSDLTGVPNTRQIKSLDSLYDVLPEIFKFPPSWTPPRVYRLPLNWRDNIFAGQGKLRVLSIEEGFSYVPTGAEVSSSRVIFLETKNGTLTRLGTLRDQAGTELELKSVPTLLPRLEETAIGRYLLLPPDQISDYLVK